MDVADRGKALDRTLHIVDLDHDHKVDHGLGGETGHSRRANVLDRYGEVADCSGHTVVEPLELKWPAWVIVDNDDRIRHGGSLCRRAYVDSSEH